MTPGTGIFKFLSKSNNDVINVLKLSLVFTLP